MRIILCSMLFLLLMCTVSTLDAQSFDYEVEVAAFNKRVTMDYFSGLQGITYYEDANNIHRYRMKGVRSMEDAKQKLASAKAMGFNARIINVAEERALYAQCQQKLDHIFFNFDQSKLTHNSKERLDNLAATLNTNPQLQAVLAGHTDAKGSNQYNDELSKARVQEAMQYLLGQNVSTNQISTAFFGEQSPIAKNANNRSRDLPAGRKFNRRVEIQIVNTTNKQNLSGFVKRINIPSELKY